jgi:CheY-like chemotaxis protein
MNILIVEDSAPMRRMIHSLVAPLALNIFECSDGGEALAVYQAHQPDWVLMDLRLGQVDGITATQKICDAYPQAKVVIVTNYDDPALRAAAADAGASGYILKDDLYQLPLILQAKALQAKA